MKNSNIILYLHGFRSSPQSYKAQISAKKMEKIGAKERFICPQLPVSPKEAIELCKKLLSPYQKEQITIFGSSLGGFYATFLAESLGCRAVLLNPMTFIPDDMTPFLNATTTYYGNEPFEFKNEYIDELRKFSVKSITNPERYLLIAAKGDELLDYRDMVKHYRDAKQIIIEGSNHALEEFEQYLDTAISFARI